MRAKSVPVLIKAIETYRANNAMAPGNPAAEVEQFYAATFPWMVSKFLPGETKEAPLPPSKHEPLAWWVNRLWKNPPKHWQESEKARARLAVCKQCPHYLALGTVADVYRRRLILLGGGRNDSTTLHCEEHLWDCGLAVWIAEPEVVKDVPGCWASSGK